MFREIRKKDRSLDISGYSRRSLLLTFGLVPAIWLLAGVRTAKSNKLETVDIARFYLRKKGLPRKFWKSSGLGLLGDKQLLALRGKVLLTELHNYRPRVVDVYYGKFQSIFEQLDNRILGEYEAGNVYEYNGWLLTETEAMLYAVSSLAG